MAIFWWNDSDKSASISLDSGDQEAYISSPGNSQWRNVRSHDGHSSGKYYFEVEIKAIVGLDIACVGVGTPSAGLDSWIGSDNYGYGYMNAGYKYHNGVSTSWGGKYSQGDIIGVALDCENGKLFFSVNNVWQGSCNPESGDNPAFSNVNGTFYSMGSMWTTNDRQKIYTKSAELNYSLPTDYEAWNDGLWSNKILVSNLLHNHSLEQILLSVPAISFINVIDNGNSGQFYFEGNALS